MPATKTDDVTHSITTVIPTELYHRLVMLAATNRTHGRPLGSVRLLAREALVRFLKAEADRAVQQATGGR